MSWQAWQNPSEQTRPRFQYSPTQVTPPNPQQDQPLPPRNDAELSRDMLLTVLTYLSTLIPAEFSHTVRLVVHGGACMLLHPGLYDLSQEHRQTTVDGMTLARRTTTRDVDYINRSFAAEWHRFGVSDATERLQKCIKATARRFGLGADWMNSDADVALPMAQGPTGTPYDPIHADSIRQNNIDLHTIFTSPNEQLTLVSVTPFWAVALKLVRYTRWDPGDICLLLRNGTTLSGTQWTPAILEGWLLQQCWPMGYAGYDAKKVEEMRARILHAVKMVWEVQSSESMEIGATARTHVGVGASMGGEENGEWGNMSGPAWGGGSAADTRGSRDWMNQTSFGNSATEMAGGGAGPWTDSNFLGGPLRSSPPIADVGSAGGWVNPAFFGTSPHHPPDISAGPATTPSSWAGAGHMTAGHSFDHGSGHAMHRNSSVEEFDRSIASILRGGSSPAVGDPPPRRRSRPKKYSSDEEFEHSPQPKFNASNGQGSWHGFGQPRQLTASNLQQLQSSLSSLHSHQHPRGSPHPLHQFSMTPPQPPHQQHPNSLGLY